MNFDELIKEFVHDYFVIVTGTVLGTLIYCFIFAPDCTFSLNYFLWILLFSTVGDMPLLLFYSKKELTEKQWIKRLIAHFITLEVLLLILGHAAEMYQGIPGGIVFALIIAGVYILVRLTCLQVNRRVALQINRQLKDLED